MSKPWEFECSNGTVLIDDEDRPVLSRYSWSLSKGYACTSVFAAGKRTSISMHRLLMGMSELHVDHINGDTTDNRKANLRLCTRSQNMANMPVRPGAVPYRGVTLNNYNRPKFKTRYSCRIRVDNQRIHLGTFDDPVEAAKVYDVAARKYFGAFAQLNFPEVPSCIEPIVRDTVEQFVKDLAAHAKFTTDRSEWLMETKFWVDRALKLLDPK